MSEPWTSLPTSSAEYSCNCMKFYYVINRIIYDTLAPCRCYYIIKESIRSQWKRNPSLCLHTKYLTQTKRKSVELISSNISIMNGGNVEHISHEYRFRLIRASKTRPFYLFLVSFIISSPFY